MCVWSALKRTNDQACGRLGSAQPHQASNATVAQPSKPTAEPRGGGRGKKSKSSPASLIALALGLQDLFPENCLYPKSSIKEEAGGYQIRFSLLSEG